MSEYCSGDWSPGLSEVEQMTLFEIANDTLKWCVDGCSGGFDFGKYELTEKLKVPMATFVTLNLDGMLRGCIGSLAPVAPLYESVRDNAANAAMKDNRFSPVSPAELPKLDVHISVLSPIVPIASIDGFKLGEHGIIIEKGYNRAVYLPEVARDQRWTIEETMSSLSQKAGLPPDGWKDGAGFEVFSSVLLSEK